MNPDLLSVLRKLPLNQQTVTAVLPVIARYGLAGALVLARGYLGPLAHRVADDPGKPAGTGATDTDTTAGTAGAADTSGTGGAGVNATGTATSGDATTGRVTLNARDSAILGLALTKLVFELGELALYNPTLDPAGRQPAFALDDKGNPPAMSVAHVLAAVRFWQQHAARREAEHEAKQAAADVAARRSPRAQLQAARSERYAVTPRYSYVAPVATYRVPR